MTKRIIDCVAAFATLIVLSPVIAAALVATWLGDRKNPVYVGIRAGHRGRIFRMYKIRTMVVDADLASPTTSSSDPRVTALGNFLRRFKIDELLQLFNVLKGDMSLVGPRPQVLIETKTYTDEEQRLLDALPGLSDLSSVVFSDMGEIVNHHPDAYLAYQQLVRPWKSRLGLFYVDHMNLSLDLAIVFATICSIVSRSAGRRIVAHILRSRGAPNELIAVALRTIPLEPYPLPGSTRVYGT